MDRILHHVCLQNPLGPLCGLSNMATKGGWKIFQKRRGAQYQFSTHENGQNTTGSSEGRLSLQRKKHFLIELSCLQLSRYSHA